MEHILITLSSHICFAREEDEKGERLENIETWEGSNVVLELKTEDLSQVGVNQSVLKSPTESHQEC